MKRRGQSKTSGFFKMKPDYEKQMFEDPEIKKKRKAKSKSKVEEDEVLTTYYPRDDYDLKTYTMYWESGHDHYDIKNKKKFGNRYLLYGRPQLGKTGVLLEIGFLIWEALGKPKHTSPIYSNVPKIPVLCPMDDEEEDENISDTEAELENRDPTHFGPYPLKSHIGNLKLEKLCVSKRYGDPNDPAVMEHYKSGATWVHESVLNSRNKIFKRAETGPSNTSMETSPWNEDSSQGIQQYSRQEVNIYDYEFCSRPLRTGSANMMNDYEIFNFQDSNQRDLGKLFTIRRRNNWIIKLNDIPQLRPNLKFPPILIPTSGRPDSALLDLSHAMKNGTDSEDEDYVQIVVLSIRDKTIERYFELLCCYPHIDIFLIDQSFHQTVGAYRYVCKMLAEQITSNPQTSKFVFIMDDNILCFNGITLKNDPNPQFGLEALSSESQRSPISLRHLLEHFSSESLNKNMMDFGIVGFSMFNPKNAKRWKKAFTR